MSVRARIGVPGQLITIPGTTALQQTAERASSRRVTLGGRLVTQEAVREHRTWDVTLRQGSSPQDVAGLAALAAGEWGRGPFTFVSEWAQATNLLTPRASLMDVGEVQEGAMIGGPLVLSDGSVAGRHLVQLPNTELLLPWVNGAPEPFPVLAGTPVCVSMYFAQPTVSGHMELLWLDAAGTQIGHNVVWAESSAVARRRSFFRVAPAGAAFGLLRSVQHTPSVNLALTRLAVTWTEQPLPWYPGQGVNSVVVEGLTTDVGAAWSKPGGQRAGYSFTVVEVN